MAEALMNLHIKVLNETNLLCYLMETDLALIYQLLDVIKYTIENLTKIKYDHEDDVFVLLLQNIKLLRETIESENFLNVDTVTVLAAATNIPPRQLKKKQIR